MDETVKCCKLKINPNVNPLSNRPFVDNDEKNKIIENCNKNNLNITKNSKQVTKIIIEENQVDKRKESPKKESQSTKEKPTKKKATPKEKPTKKKATTKEKPTKKKTTPKEKPTKETVEINKELKKMKVAELKLLLKSLIEHLTKNEYKDLQKYVNDTYKVTLSRLKKEELIKTIEHISK